MDELLEIINQLTSKVVSRKFNSREFKTKDDFLKHFYMICQLAMHRNEKAFDYTSYAFGPLGYLYEIADFGGWINEYNIILKKFSYLINYYRSCTKLDPRIGGAIDPELLGNSYSIYPGKIILSEEKVKKIILRRKFSLISTLSFYRKKKTLKINTFLGATNPAIVMSLKPLLVAAYASDLDAVVLLKFPEEYVKQYQLEVYSHLISVNTYCRREMYMDIFYGKYYSAWADFKPVIVNFVTDDIRRLKDLEEVMPNCLWKHVQSLAEDYLYKHPNLYRPGLWFR